MIHLSIIMNLLLGLPTHITHSHHSLPKKKRIGIILSSTTKLNVLVRSNVGSGYFLFFHSLCDGSFNYCDNRRASFLPGMSSDFFILQLTYEVTYSPTKEY